jgi:1-acyl-sn-glycerol-3-phosphate acyltransferase
MSLEAGVPVVPVGLIGMFALQPAGRLIPKLGKVEVRIGKPLDFSRYSGMEGDRFVLRSITDEIMYELMVLSGQEYVDQYATKAKAEIELARAAARESLVSDAPAPVRRAS